MYQISLDDDIITNYDYIYSTRSTTIVQSWFVNKLTSLGVVHSFISVLLFGNIVMFLLAVLNWSNDYMFYLLNTSTALIGYVFLCTIHGVFIKRLFRTFEFYYVVSCNIGFFIFSGLIPFDNNLLRMYSILFFPSSLWCDKYNN
jgi:hypothetical protein